MKSIFKWKTQRAKEHIQLENICDGLKDNYFTTDVVIAVKGEGGDPDQQFEGKLILSKYPIEEKTVKLGGPA